MFPEFPTMSMVVKYCHNLVGLKMEAPLAAANVYFNAAINMKYVLLLVDMTDEEDHFERESNQLIIYPIHVAKGHYDQDTGKILPCPVCEDNCDVWGKRWYFCSGEVDTSKYFIIAK